MATKLPWLVERPLAHRGLHALEQGRPENSLAAFEAAVEAGYAIECDVHLAADGVPVVFHDDELERLTEGTGHVRDLTSTELAELAIAGTRERIPTLAQLLSLVAGRVPLVIELKSIPGRDTGLAPAVVDLLKSYRGDVAVMSFDAGLLADVTVLLPDLARGLTAEGGAGTVKEQLKTIRRLKLDFVSYSVDDLPHWAPFLMRTFFGMPVICWTVRNAQQRRKAKFWADQITFEGFYA
ncbi:Glycerophosphoryl diester phosphodiesterase [Faunimonas pinastri]|uniref:Glycerophosphoryl diester phosphodiesterase n=1 Tax=Faunimonas pinastri TaxID=1855383 RepID=A0A1H9CH11_9HYPH|nr:glycerophosphodiester phosphodiesterase family protein [Faunimonas pinastri]SEQ00496.1 Glycerophosphoryl diester phosphodiesterase [Faunimonas pinastri]